ncbi:MAG: DUF4870 domain-containing protein [Deltaproteobacteria bacterium]|nr:DUF4870 domain-containing protein [Deltaproteobacteria bacterium]
MAAMDEKEARTWAMLCHLGGLGVYVVPTIGHLLAPLIIWLIKKDESPLVDDQGKESLNFQITITIYAVIAALLIPLFGLGAVFLIALGIFDLIIIIIAAVKANDGEKYRYPLCIRFIK